MNDAVSLNETGVAEPLSPATLVGGRFQIKSFVRSEAGTELYQAIDTGDNAPVLLRLFSCPAARRVVLESDLTQAAAVTHRNLFTIVALGHVGSRVFLASEPQEGATLRHIIDTKRAQNQLVGLAHAHVLLGHAVNAIEASYPRLCHGGAHPAAIYLNKAGRVKVANLGLTRAMPAVAHAGLPSGATFSPYLAPEVAAGAAPSAASDVFSLTAILYELVTGHAPTTPPWPASQVNGELPKSIDKIIERGLAALPETRFAKPSQLVAEVGTVLAHASAPKQDVALPAPEPALAKSFSVSDAVRLSEEYERWLVRKDNLDFGPFSLAQLMTQMEHGAFGGNDFIVDADSGDRQKIKEHPQLAEYCRVVERKLETQRRRHAEQAHEHTERRKGLWVIVISSLALLLVAGGLLVFLKGRKAVQEDHLASRVSEADVDKFLKDVKVEFTQPKRAARRSGSGTATNMGNGVSGKAEDFNNAMDYGDVSKDGGDALLDEGIIDRVMRANYRKIVPCAMQSGQRTIELEFVVQPTGRVKAVQVNGQRKGSMAVCILNQMQSFGFPAYRGKNTIANWSMSFR